MESLINVQLDRQSKIEKARANFKKSPKERLCFQYVETRLESLESLWSDFRETHSKIIETCKIELLNKSDYVIKDVYDNADESYIVYKTELKMTLSALAPTSKVCQNAPTVTNTSNCDSAVRLPEITIPMFSGKYCEWTTFRDLFISLLHNNQSLGDIQKLYYLKGHLTGEAEQLLRHVPITASNYSQCWSQLECRYNNKKYLVGCILKRLFGQRSASVESASALKDLLDTTNDCLQALTNLGVEINSWDIIIIHLINYKLDPETRKQWELTVASDSTNELPTLRQYQKFIESRFRALESIEHKAKSLRVSSSHSNKLRSFHVTTNVCEYCAENHKLCFCKKFAKNDFHKRHSFVMKKRLCFNCFGNNHSVKQCQKASSCRICHKRHHSLLHPKSFSAVHNRDKQINSKTKNTSNVEIISTSTNVAPVGSCFSAGKGKCQVLLATALVNAESKNGSTRVIRALLDQGSQASLVTEATVQRLGLKKVPLKDIISGVSNNKKVISKAIVFLTIQSRVDPSINIRVKAHVLKSITSPLPVVKTTGVEVLHLQGLYLADPQFHTPNKIDILLGADVYGQVIQKDIRKGASGNPVAQATSLGWILYGTIPSDVSNYTDLRKTVVTHASITELEPKSKNTLIETTLVETPKKRRIVRLPLSNIVIPCKMAFWQNITDTSWLPPPR